MKKDYDVCVIGGGPSGLSAAKFTARKGLKTLLFERKKEIGSRVVCGEFIPAEEEAKRLLPKSRLSQEFYNNLPHECITNKTRTVRVYAPNGRYVDLKFKGLVIDRSILEKSYAKEAEGSSLEILTSTTALKGIYREELINISYVKDGTTQEASTSYVIGADGFPSKVARWFNLCSGYDRLRDEALCLNSVLKLGRLQEDVVEMYAGTNIAPGGYAWIIPKGDGAANVGLGVRRRWMNPELNIEDYYKHFVSKHIMISENSLRNCRRSIGGKVIPLGGIVEEICHERVVLAGDSAGLVIPVNGSGILTAAISGVKAGEAVWNEHIGKDGIAKYRGKLLSEIGDSIYRGLLYRYLVDAAVTFDRIFDLSFLVAGSSMVSNLLLIQEHWMLPILRYTHQLSQDLCFS